MGDGGSSGCDNLESILQDPNSQPCDLRLQYLRDITNNFSSEQELGRGGFGVVYKGVLPYGEMVAVKNLRSMSQFQEKQFKNEVDTLMRVRHQNIVRFVGYCYETWHEYIEYNGGHVFAETPKRLLCFEYMPNGSLDKYISEETCGLDWQKRYRIIKGICCGLHYLHKECQVNSSLIHLDLKPENILLDDNMVPKIADFGLAKLFEDPKTQSLTTAPVGSRGYMSPEYLYEGIISTKADIYSLGVIIIQLITGLRVKHYDSFLSQDFVEHVVKKWRKRFEAAPSETDCNQIKSCLEIGLRCVRTNHRERPTTMEIIKILDIWGSTNCSSEEERPVANQINSNPRELLEITPLELCFSLELNKRISCLVKLTNKTDDYVAFYFGVMMAKNTYVIEPTSGFLRPQTTFNVVVTMEERQELPLDWQCNDEFLVQSIAVGKHISISKPITVDMINSMPTNLVNKVKLTVVYLPPPPAQLPLLSHASETSLRSLPTSSSPSLDKISDQGETKTWDPQLLEGLLVDLLRAQLRREMQKKGAPDVTIVSKVNDVLARIYNAGPESQKSDEPIQPENLSKDNLELHIVILLFSEISRLSKSDLEKKVFELVDGLETVGAPDSPKTARVREQSIDGKENSSDEVKDVFTAEDVDVGDDELNRRAEVFIKNFYQQLKLERLNPLQRYKEEIRITDPTRWIGSD